MPPSTERIANELIVDGVSVGLGTWTPLANRRIPSSPLLSRCLFISPALRIGWLLIRAHACLKAPPARLWSHHSPLETRMCYIYTIGKINGSPFETPLRPLWGRLFSRELFVMWWLWIETAVHSLELCSLWTVSQSIQIPLFSRTMTGAAGGSLCEFPLCSHTRGEL